MSQPYFINYQRGLANTEICQNYVKDLIMQIRNTNMHNAPSHLTRGDKIKDCLKYVKQTIIAFERSACAGGYRRYSNAAQREAVVAKLLEITANSDYVNHLYAIYEHNNNNYDPREATVIAGLMKRLTEVRQRIRSLAN